MNYNKAVESWGRFLIPSTQKRLWADAESPTSASRISFLPVPLLL